MHPGVALYIVLGVVATPATVAIVVASLGVEVRLVTEVVDALVVIAGAIVVVAVVVVAGVGAIVLVDNVAAVVVDAVTVEVQ